MRMKPFEFKGSILCLVVAIVAGVVVLGSLSSLKDQNEAVFDNAIAVLYRMVKC